MFQILREGSEEFNNTFNVTGAITNNIHASGLEYLKKIKVSCIIVEKNEDVGYELKGLLNEGIILSGWVGGLPEEVKHSHHGKIWAHSLGW